MIDILKIILKFMCGFLVLPVLLGGILAAIYFNKYEIVALLFLIVLFCGSITIGYVFTMGKPK